MHWDGDVDRENKLIRMMNKQQLTYCKLKRSERERVYNMCPCVGFDSIFFWMIRERERERVCIWVFGVAIKGTDSLGLIDLMNRKGRA